MTNITYKRKSFRLQKISVDDVLNSFIPVDWYVIINKDDCIIGHPVLDLSRALIILEFLNSMDLHEILAQRRENRILKNNGK